MRYSKSTRYALCAVLQMARAGEQPVTVGQVAELYRIPPGALAKVFKDLVKAGIAVGVRGIGGGYCLARAPSEVTVLDVIATFDPPHEEQRLLPGGEETAEADRRLRRLFLEVDETARCTFASVTLETLLR